MRRFTTQYWTSMDDKDHVFAHFKDDKPAASDRREILSIPRRGSAMGSRTVEVVHVRSSGAPTGKGQPRRLTFTDRAATWENGFPTRSPAQLPAMVDAGAPVRAEPVTHVMPMWEPAAVAAEVTLPACDEAPAALASSAAEASYPRARQSARRVADPFDASDDGANCMRCGYAIEPAREKCGFMTCAACR
jgi:hypothetical protein